jgi:hypothetical protein
VHFPLNPVEMWRFGTEYRKTKKIEGTRIKSNGQEETSPIKLSLGRNHLMMQPVSPED